MAEKKANKMMVLLSRKMLACDESVFLISKSSDGKLSLREKTGLRIHLLTCHICRKYEKQIRQLNLLLGYYRDECLHEHSRHSLTQQSKEIISRSVEKELNRQ